MTRGIALRLKSLFWLRRIFAVARPFLRDRLIGFAEKRLSPENVIGIEGAGLAYLARFFVGVDFADSGAVDRTALMLVAPNLHEHRASTVRHDRWVGGLLLTHIDLLT